MEPMDHVQRATEFFNQGYGCAQSIMLAFAKESGLPTTVLARMGGSMGAGMGRLREVCGAVSGMFLIAGLLYGYESPTDAEGKAEHYARIQELAAEFRRQKDSIICRELLGVSGSEAPQPDPRTAQYYQTRPCVDLVRCAAQVLDTYLAAHPVDHKGDE